MVVVLLRVAVLGVVLSRLAYTAPGDPTWASGLIPSLVTAVVAAIVMVTEPRAWLRRTMFAAVALAYAVWMLRDSAWHTDGYFVRLALLTVGEAAIVALFLETRIWRWSLVPALVLFVCLVYWVFPTYANDVVLRRAVTRRPC